MWRAIAAVLAIAAPALADPASLVLPVTPACISSPFGERREGAGGPRASRDHQGIDLPAPAGAWVVAAEAGQISAVRRRGAAGLEVELRHADGLVTRYAHLGTVAPAIATGRRRVARGERLGRIGRSGITYGTHLHFEVLVGGRRVDPTLFLAVRPC